jgi:hypothetical protein
MRGLGLLWLAGILLAAGSCGDRIVSVSERLVSRRIDVDRGDLIDIRLLGGARGMYDSPPSLSSSAVEFLDVTVETGSGGVVNPGGPTQRFRFRALTSGSAVVTFVPLQSLAPTVSDTIIVR